MRQTLSPRWGFLPSLIAAPRLAPWAVLLRRFAASLWLSNTHGLRRGLHSCAASRLPSSRTVVASSLILTAKKVRRSDNRHIGRRQTTGRISNVEERPFQGRVPKERRRGFSQGGRRTSEDKSGLLRPGDSRYCGEHLRRETQHFCGSSTAGACSSTVRAAHS